MDKHWATLTNIQRTQLKRYALTENDHNTYNNINWQISKAYANAHYDIGDHLERSLYEAANQVHPRYLQVVNSLIRSRQIKSKRLKDKITYLVSQGQAYFLTFTFTDEVLNSTSEATRRKYITRLLKEQSQHYVANIDFGKTTGREHYHAVLNAFITPDLWPYGFIKSMIIGNDESTPVKLGKYITKLSNHALKDTTEGKSRFRTLIYSRNK